MEDWSQQCQVQGACYVTTILSDSCLSEPTNLPTVGDFENSDWSPGHSVWSLLSLMEGFIIITELEFRKKGFYSVMVSRVLDEGDVRVSRTC